MISRAAFAMVRNSRPGLRRWIASLDLFDPTVGLNYTLSGFLALAIWGFGSIRGAIAGVAFF